MPGLWRRRQVHRTPGRAPARRRHTLVVDLPEAPGSLHRPAPLALLLSPDRPGWQLSGDANVVAGLAVLLATLDLAPPGPLVGLVGDDPAPALLAAVYSTRPVRAVAADGLVAHSARQAASSNALPLVVEERRIAGAGGTSLDEYVATTGLAPAVVHVGAGVDPDAVLAGAHSTLTLHRAWLVVTGDVLPEPALAATPRATALNDRLATQGRVPGHEGLYVLAPEGTPTGLATTACTFSRQRVRRPAWPIASGPGRGCWRPCRCGCRSRRDTPRAAASSTCGRASKQPDRADPAPVRAAGPTRADLTRRHQREEHLSTTDPTSSATPPPRPRPGGRARTVVARAVPRPVKVALRRRLRGTWLFPTPPPRSPGSRPGAAAVRVVELHLPLTAGDRSPADGRRLVLEAPRSMYVPNRLSQTGLAAYEQRALECFLALTETAGPGAVLDVGANVGLYGLLAAAASDRDVRAFEPTPALAGVARDTAAANGLALVVEELALGREAGTASFFLSDTTDSSNSLAAGFRPSSQHLEVTVDTLDAYCARTGLTPALIKVDTETTEPDVLAGGAGTIDRHRPWILCEVLPGRRTGDLAEVMRPHGYTWYHLGDDDEPQPVDSMDGDPTYAHLMYLLAPEPVGPEFWARVRAWRQALEAVQPGVDTARPVTIELPTEQPSLRSH